MHGPPPIQRAGPGTAGVKPRRPFPRTRLQKIHCHSVSFLSPVVQALSGCGRTFGSVQLSSSRWLEPLNQPVDLDAYRVFSASAYARTAHNLSRACKENVKVFRSNIF